MKMQIYWFAACQGKREQVSKISVYHQLAWPLYNRYTMLLFFTHNCSFYIRISFLFLYSTSSLSLIKPYLVSFGWIPLSNSFNPFYLYTLSRFHSPLLTSLLLLLLLLIRCFNSQHFSPLFHSYFLSAARQGRRVSDTLYFITLDIVCFIRS